LKLWARGNGLMSERLSLEIPVPDAHPTS
jgi:hypothetical protein